MYTLGPPYPWMNKNITEYELDGATVILSNNSITLGDLYLAGRNTGPHLLTCRKISDNCVFPEEAAYAYDLCECRKVDDIK
jgi:hypothetical protein